MADRLERLPERDPRVEPRVGDEICRDFKTAHWHHETSGVVLRKVTRAHGGFVFFTKDNGYQRRPGVVSEHEWRKWAKKAEVVECAQ